MSTIIDEQLPTDASIWSTAFKWGVISALVGFVMTLVFYNTGMMEVQPSGRFSALVTWFPLLVGLVLTYLGLTQYRDGSNNGRLSLGRSLKWGLGYGMVSGILGGITTALFFGVLAPELMEEMTAMQIAQMEEQNMSDEQIEQAMQVGSMFMGPLAFAIFGAIGGILFGFFQSLVVGLFVKTH